MEKFTRLEGVAAPLRMINVDTDMIIPKQYLKTIKRTGLAKGLFALFNAVGFTLPNSGILVKPRTVIVALVVGILVTVLASLRAGERPPVLRDAHFTAVLAEMNGERQALTRSLLGVGPGEDGAAGADPDGRPLRHSRFR